MVYSWRAKFHGDLSNPIKATYLFTNETRLLCMLKIVSVSLGHSSVHSLLDPCNVVHVAIKEGKKIVFGSSISCSIPILSCPVMIHFLVFKQRYL